MKIYIISARRPQRQITAKQFKPNSKHTIFTVVPESDQHDYLQHQATENYIFHHKQGIRNTRQFVVDDYTHGNKFCQLDDDLTFYKRLEAGNFVKATPDDVELMFDEIETKLDSYAHVGVVDKFMSHLQPRDFISNARYNQVLAYNTKLFPVPHPKFRVALGEEQDFNLQLLSQGRESCILTEWSKSTTNYAEGGCAQWRTAEIELAAHKEMVDLWPGIVTLRDNKNTISKTSLSIAWRKAYVPNPGIHPFKVTSIPA